MYLICIPTIHIYCYFAGAIMLWRDYYEKEFLSVPGKFEPDGPV